MEKVATVVLLELGGKTLMGEITHEEGKNPFDAEIILLENPFYVQTQLIPVQGKNRVEVPGGNQQMGVGVGTILLPYPADALDIELGLVIGTTEIPDDSTLCREYYEMIKRLENGNPPVVEINPRKEGR